MYVMTFVEMKPDQFVEVPDQKAKVLKDFIDIMPPQLPRPSFLGVLISIRWS